MKFLLIAALVLTIVVLWSTKAPCAYCNLGLICFSSQDCGPAQGCLCLQTDYSGSGRCALSR